MNKISVFFLCVSLFIFGILGYQFGKAANHCPAWGNYQQGYLDGQIDYGCGTIKVAQVQFAPNDVEWLDTTNWDTSGWNVQFLPAFDAGNVHHYSTE